MNVKEKSGNKSSLKIVRVSNHWTTVFILLFFTSLTDQFFVMQKKTYLHTAYKRLCPLFVLQVFGWMDCKERDSFMQLLLHKKSWITVG